MDLSHPQFKALAVTAGLCLWFFIITSALNFFTIEYFLIFFVSVFTITQILSKKLAGALEVFAIINTKIFLGILYIFVITIYGILFRILKIDVLRYQKQNETYWLEMKQLKKSRIFKQY